MGLKTFSAASLSKDLVFSKLKTRNSKLETSSKLPHCYTRYHERCRRAPLELAVVAGFMLALLAFLSYFLFFVQFALTRNFPWMNLLLFAVAAGLLWVGIRRAFRSPALYRGKIFGPILAVLSVLIFGFFAFAIFVAGRQMPASAAAPHVGAKAPDFTLTDSANKPVSLAALLATPLHGAAPRGVLLVFYRGYW